MTLTRRALTHWLPLFLWIAVIFTISAETNPYLAAWKIASAAYHRLVVPPPDTPTPQPTLQPSPGTPPNVTQRPPLVRALRALLRHVDSEIVGSVAHFLEYALLGLLMLRALAPPAGTPEPSTLPQAAFFASLAYALLDEVHQIFVPNRSFELIDLTLDALGIALGIWLYLRLRQYARQKAHHG
jgi:VanZ family protein